MSFFTVKIFKFSMSTLSFALDNIHIAIINTSNLIIASSLCSRHDVYVDDSTASFSICYFYSTFLSSQVKQERRLKFNWIRVFSAKKLFGADHGNLVYRPSIVPCQVENSKRPCCLWWAERDGKREWGDSKLEFLQKCLWGCCQITPEGKEGILRVTRTMRCLTHKN